MNDDPPRKRARKRRAKRKGHAASPEDRANRATHRALERRDRSQLVRPKALRSMARGPRAPLRLMARGPRAPSTRGRLESGLYLAGAATVSTVGIAIVGMGESLIGMVLVLAGLVALATTIHFFGRLGFDPPSDLHR